MESKELFRHFVLKTVTSASNFFILIFFAECSNERQRQKARTNLPSQLDVAIMHKKDIYGPLG